MSSDREEVDRLAGELLDAAEQAVAQLEGELSDDQARALGRLLEYLRLLKAVGPDREEFESGVREVGRIALQVAQGQAGADGRS